jgi:hypothetical protein
MLETVNARTYGQFVDSRGDNSLYRGFNFCNGAAGCGEDAPQGTCQLMTYLGNAAFHPPADSSKGWYSGPPFLYSPYELTESG